MLEAAVAHDLDMSSLKDAINVFLRDDSHQDINSEVNHSVE